MGSLVTGIYQEMISMTKSSKQIDHEIEEELDGLLKYGSPRKSNIISDNNSVAIADTDHFVTITKLGMIKKLPYNPVVIEKKRTPALGAFKAQDYPLFGLVINNHDSLMMFDGFGRYSVVPVHEIENTEPAQYGNRVFDVSKLNGEIVTALQFFNEDTKSFINKNLHAKVNVVTLTKNGYLKKTPIEEFTKSRNQKNVRAMKIRKDDELAVGMIVLDFDNKGTNIDIII